MVIKELQKRTGHNICISSECGCSGTDLPFLNYRITYEKHGEGLEKEIRNKYSRDPRPREGLLERNVRGERLYLRALAARHRVQARDNDLEINELRRQLGSSLTGNQWCRSELGRDRWVRPISKGEQLPLREQQL